MTGTSRQSDPAASSGRLRCIAPLGLDRPELPCLSSVPLRAAYSRHITANLDALLLGAFWKRASVTALCGTRISEIRVFGPSGSLHGTSQRQSTWKPVNVDAPFDPPATLLITVGSTKEAEIGDRPRGEDPLPGFVHGSSRPRARAIQAR
ncbi:hypothetical protein N658DRAFT_498361 [Parathielavia hyrcaniae]|uniref:Uncharacterized protein n=1 Tax=Parathielavia hyrcaniae TaxID=113614 RepID=A0AAN6PWV1_9PEZI|nr:hypothetical protein N658DRAFT_498361 [Parathielavia hyrcaniae]